MVVGLADMGDRFRLVANEVEVVEPDEPLPELPVACAVWKPKPDLRTATESWLAAGAPHHTVLSTAIGVDALGDFAEMARTELVVIDGATTTARLRQRAALEPGLPPPRPGALTLATNPNNSNNHEAAASMRGNTMDSHSRRSRRDLLRTMGVTTAAGVALSQTGFSPVQAARQRAGAGNFPETPEWSFVFVNHVTTNPFFVPTIYGIEDASAILGTTHQWTGSEGSDIGEMVNAMRQRSAEAPTGSASRSSISRRSTDRSDEAIGGGHPVVSYNADAPNGRLAYVGQDLYGSGF